MLQKTEVINYQKNKNSESGLYQILILKKPPNILKFGGFLMATDTSLTDV